MDRLGGGHRIGWGEGGVCHLIDRIVGGVIGKVRGLCQWIGLEWGVIGKDGVGLLLDSLGWRVSLDKLGLSWLGGGLSMGVSG